MYETMKIIQKSKATQTNHKTNSYKTGSGDTKKKTKTEIPQQKCQKEYC